ncbi:DUF6183 family protein [Streptomyces swartbergensis]|uniref:DUF6183 family protein n=1 Tax=Streptomyces swartbergensis TaxID=487165 RepID=UPI001FC985FB|nr:DUF6183 family protein [Streptomyces swartbergensis]
MSFIEELPPRCLAGEGTYRGSALACATTPDEVLNELFSASYNGGVNGQGQGGAYAWLYAWDSLYALMGPRRRTVPGSGAARRGSPVVAVHGVHGLIPPRLVGRGFRRTRSRPDSGRGAGGDRYRRRARRSRVATVRTKLTG